VRSTRAEVLDGKDVDIAHELAQRATRAVAAIPAPHQTVWARSCSVSTDQTARAAATSRYAMFARDLQVEVSDGGHRRPS